MFQTFDVRKNLTYTLTANFYGNNNTMTKNGHLELFWTNLEIQPFHAIHPKIYLQPDFTSRSY